MYWRRFLPNGAYLKVARINLRGDPNFGKWLWSLRGPTGKAVHGGVERTLKAARETADRKVKRD